MTLSKALVIGFGMIATAVPVEASAGIFGHRRRCRPSCVQPCPRPCQSGSSSGSDSDGTSSSVAQLRQDLDLLQLQLARQIALLNNKDNLLTVSDAELKKQIEAIQKKLDEAKAAADKAEGK